ncbi:MAG: hypothetical protein O0X93_08020 [Methanocorpusculum sp.]|nr:hypothetical protein [Methanocorpusculum sp.]MDE2444320.1 hypothetical protein [Methanocorpusculum sp.]MDE2518253.1 hypothetical protein [Methanocorpusculum sp.]MDE2523084.1 hypothetical protein [Methanocorpusculum sp.]MDE2523891.1 hypothetical protein [Methanocorpusculum sp.]
MASEKSKGDNNVIKLNGEKKIVIVASSAKGKGPNGSNNKQKGKTVKKAADSHKKLAKQTKAAKKTLKELKKEKQAAEILMNYCTSMGKYFADQSAIDTLMDVALDSQNSVDEQAAEIIPDLAAEAGVATGETTDEFLKGFHESEEYAAALVAYRNRLETENIILDETDAETPEE